MADAHHCLLPFTPPGKLKEVSFPVGIMMPVDSEEPGYIIFLLILQYMPPVFEELSGREGVGM